MLLWFVLDKMWVEPNEGVLRLLLIISLIGISYGYWPVARAALRFIWAARRIRFHLAGERPQEPARQVRPQRSVCSDGIRWVFVSYNYMRGVDMRPECKDHGAELKLRNADGTLSPLRASIWARERDRKRLSLIPFCVEGHEVPHKRSANYEQASGIARVKLEREVRSEFE